MDFDDDFEAVPKRRRIGGGNSGGGRASDDAFVMIDLCASEDEDEAGGGGGGGGAAPAKQPNLLFEGGVEIVGESRSSAPEWSSAAPATFLSSCAPAARPGPPPRPRGQTVLAVAHVHALEHLQQDILKGFSVRGATDAVNELRVGMNVSHTSEPKLRAAVSDHIFDPNM